MGCFGDMTPTKKTEGGGASFSGPAPWIETEGQKNYGVARAVLDRGFQPYGGELTAPLANNERMASDIIAGTAATKNPYQQTAADDFTNYGAAPATQYGFNTVTDENGPLGAMSGYMDPYLEAVLAPQLRQLAISGSQQRQGINANATNAGAYGDARHGVVESEQRKNEALQGTDIVGQAFSQAFGQAMQQRQQDAARQFQTQQAQGTADKEALERMRTSGIDLTNLDKYGVSRDLGLASALGTTGQTEREVQQKSDDAQFNEFMRQQGFDSNQVAFLTSILKTTPSQTWNFGQQQQTTSQPNNSGWQAVGALAQALFL